MTTSPSSDYPDLVVEYDELGRPVRVVVDDIDITGLVARVQSVTDTNGTKHEVVLSVDLPPVFRQ